MQSLHEGVRSTVNSTHDELMGTGTSGKDGSGRSELSKAENFTRTSTEPLQKVAKQIHRVLAARFWNLRQRRGREVLLND